MHVAVVLRAAIDVKLQLRAADIAHVCATFAVAVRSRPDECNLQRQFATCSRAFIGVFLFWQIPRNNIAAPSLPGGSHAAQVRCLCVAQVAAHVRARAATLAWEVRALALQCTVPADHEALQRAGAALGEVVVSNGGRVLPDAPVAPAHAPAPVPEPAPAAGAGTEGGALRWMLSAIAGGDAD